MHSKSLDVMVHKLAMDPEVEPVKQKKRYLAPSRNNFISEEVTKLLSVRFIGECYYPGWIANVIMVRKPNKM